jgi:hypothetical protein
MSMEEDVKQKLTLVILDQWRFFNSYYLNSSLRPPMIRLYSGRSRFGYWDGDSRLIGISLEHIMEHPWTRVMDTLRHEMAHQYVQEVLMVADETPHGEAFQHACRRLAVPAHAGESWYYDPADSYEGGRAMERNPVVEKISKLLSLATSPNEHEAQLAMKKAHELLLRHQISEADLRSDADAAERPYRVMEVGPAKARFERWEKKLISILQQYFFVDVIWVPSLIRDRITLGNVPLAHGRPENLAMADYVYNYFNRLLPELWKEFKKERGLRSDKNRREYYYGVMTGFSEKLAEQKAYLANEKALVWKGDRKLREFFRQLHPFTSSRSSSSATVGQAFLDGRETGKSVVLNKPIQGDHGNRGRLLN